MNKSLMAGVIDRSLCILQMFIPALFYIIKTINFSIGRCKMIPSRIEAFARSIYSTNFNSFTIVYGQDCQSP